MLCLKLSICGSYALLQISVDAQFLTCVAYKRFSPATVRFSAIISSFFFIRYEDRFGFGREATTRLFNALEDLRGKCEIDNIVC